MLIALFLAIFKLKPFMLKAPLTFSFALLLIWTAINILYTFRPSDWSDIYKYLIKNIIYFYLLYNFFQTKTWFMILTWAILVSVCLLSAGGLIYFYILSNHEITTRFGFPDFASVNNIGVILGVGILLALMNVFSRHRLLSILSLFTIISATAATLLCQSRGSMAGILIALAALFHKNYKALLVVFLISASVPFMIFDSKLKDRFSLASFNERVGLQIIYWKMIQDKPLVGYGFSGQTYYADHVIKTFKRLGNSSIMPEQLRYAGPFLTPHNMLTDIALRTGIIGLLAFLYALFVFSRSCLMMIRRGHDAFIRKWALCIFAIFISYVIQGMSTDVLLNYQSGILYIIFGMATIIWRINVDSDKLDSECIS
jgi:O-antigen ligase